MYEPINSNEIDAAMLSRTFYDLDKHLNNVEAICAIGGTALMLMGLKRASLDIDIIPLGNSSDINNALKYVYENIAKGQIFIPITENKKEVKRYVISKNLIIQTFTRKLPLQKQGEYLILPSDFEQYIHEVKTVRWILPEGGKEIRISTKKIFSNTRLFTLGINDLICTKIFSPRQKDVEDIYALLKHIPLSQRYFVNNKKKLLERFQEYIKFNESNIKVIVTGINFYNKLVSDPKINLLDLPEDFIKKYAQYLQ